MAKQEIDEHAETELRLYIDNDPRLHEQWKAIVRNLWGHKNKDRFLVSRAADGFMYLVDAGAKRYIAEYGHKGARVDSMFNRATRRSLAEDYADSFVRNARDEKRLSPATPAQKTVVRVGKRCCKV